MPESNPKKLSRRHHYLPQMYLRGFADEADLVWVFDRQNNTYLHQGVLNTAVKRDFYTVTGPDGHKTDAVETMMANMVEAPMKRIIERLDERNLTWEGEDREILALFVALLRTRNPAFDRDQNEFTEQFHRWWAKATHSTPEAVEQSICKYEQETGEEMSDISAQELFEMIRDDHYELKNPRQNNIKAMLSLSLEVAKAVFRLNWEILSAPKGTSFITCDNPFTVVPPPFFDDTVEGYGILTPGASTVVPLSCKTAICFHGEGERIRGAVVRRDFLRNVNAVVAANSERFVIARDEPLLRSIVRKTKLDQWQPRPRFQMIAPDPYGLKPSEPEPE
ncbi:MAG: DUF4238 domain-containing protein [Bryobacteraceae bacterium]|jgi:hypothetical protein